MACTSSFVLVAILGRALSAASPRKNTSHPPRRIRASLCLLKRVCCTAPQNGPFLGPPIRITSSGNIRLGLGGGISSPGVHCGGLNGPKRTKNHSKYEAPHHFEWVLVRLKAVQTTKTDDLRSRNRPILKTQQSHFQTYLMLKG